MESEPAIELWLDLSDGEVYRGRLADSSTSP